MNQRIRTPASPSQETLTKPLSGNQAAKEALAKMVQAVPLKKISELPDRKSRLHYVADMIEQQALVKDGIGFNMTVYRSDKDIYRDQAGHQCGTAACIAGWTVLLEKGSKYRKGQHDNIAEHFHSQARLLLGLTSNQANDLFLMDGSEDEFDMESVTDKRAVSVLRHLAETGEVAWDKFDKHGKEIK